MWGHELCGLYKVNDVYKWFSAALASDSLMSNIIPIATDVTDRCKNVHCELVHITNRHTVHVHILPFLSWFEQGTEDRRTHHWCLRSWQHQSLSCWPPWQPLESVQEQEYLPTGIVWMEKNSAEGRCEQEETSFHWKSVRHSTFKRPVPWEWIPCRLIVKQYSNKGGALETPSIFKDQSRFLDHRSQGWIANGKHMYCRSSSTDFRKQLEEANLKHEASKPWAWSLNLINHTHSCVNPQPY